MNLASQYTFEINQNFVPIDSHIITTFKCGNRYNYRGKTYTLSCNYKKATVAIENLSIATIQYHGNR
jgi:hypothetical protein